MEKLFNKDFGVSENDSQLREILENNPAYHSAYLRISCDPNKKIIKQRLEDFWTNYQDYADRNFLEEIRRNFFHQRAWEMYVANVSLDKGLSLVSRKTRGNEGPDIKIKTENKDIWIEAVAPTGGKGADAVPPTAYGEVMNTPEEEWLLRATTSIDEKKKHIIDG